MNDEDYIVRTTDQAFESEITVNQMTLIEDEIELNSVDNTKALVTHRG